MRGGMAMEIVREMARNRESHDEAVRELRRNAALSPRVRRRLLREAWVGAMRRHYALLDAYLAERNWERHSGARCTNLIGSRELRAPDRPPEVPESIRPNLVRDIGSSSRV